MSRSKLDALRSEARSAAEKRDAAKTTLDAVPLDKLTELGAAHAAHVAASKLADEAAATLAGAEAEDKAEKARAVAAAEAKAKAAADAKLNAERLERQKQSEAALAKVRGETVAAITASIAREVEHEKSIKAERAARDAAYAAHAAQVSLAGEIAQQRGEYIPRAAPITAALGGAIRVAMLAPADQPKHITYRHMCDALLGVAHSEPASNALGRYWSVEDRIASIVDGSHAVKAKAIGDVVGAGQRAQTGLTGENRAAGARDLVEAQKRLVEAFAPGKPPVIPPREEQIEEERQATAERLARRNGAAPAEESLS